MVRVAHQRRVPGEGSTGQALPRALPAHLRDAAIEDWFDERVRPLVSFGDADGTWGTIAGGLTGGELATIEDRMRRADGAPPRTALTILAGWRAGYLAWLIAVGLLRDGVLVRPRALCVLRHPDGWCGDARLVAPEVVVVAGHPWSSRAGVAAVADRAALEAEAVAEIARAGTPVVDALARRADRGSAGMWGQVADALGNAASSLQRAEPAVGPAAVICAIERLLRAPGAPWKQAPRFWIAATSSGAVVVKHRRSCCLSYRCDREARAEAPGEELDAAYLQRFGDEPPHYCSTCLFRPPEDVEERAVFDAERAAI